MIDDDEAAGREPGAVSDADLVLRSRSGDPAAFGELWSRHYRSGIAVARSISPGADADDLVQEAYTKIYHAIIKGGGPTGSFRAYLFTSIRNTAAGWGRSTRETTIDELEALEDPATSEQATAESLDRSLTHQAFQSLPTRWQEVLWYSEIEAMKPAEIAPLLGMKATAVAQLTFRAREGLREAWIQAHLRTVADGSDCAWSIERLGAYARANVGRRDRAKLEAHLSSCTRCAIVASEAKEVSSRLALVLIPLTVGVAGTAGYLATLQGAAAPAVALAAMPAAVTQGAGGSGLATVGAGGSLASGGSGVAATAAGTAGATSATGAAAGAVAAGAGSAAAATGAVTGGLLSGAGIAGLAAAGLVVATTVVAAVALPDATEGHDLATAAITETAADDSSAQGPLDAEADTSLPGIADAGGPAPGDVPELPAEAGSDPSAGGDTAGSTGAAASDDGADTPSANNGKGTTPSTHPSSAPSDAGQGNAPDGTNNGTVHSGNTNSGSGNSSGVVPITPLSATLSIASSPSSSVDGQTFVHLTISGEPGAVVQVRIRGVVAGSATIGPDGTAPLTLQPTALDLQVDARVEVRYTEAGHPGAMAGARLSELL